MYTKNNTLLDEISFNTYTNSQFGILNYGYGLIERSVDRPRSQAEGQGRRVAGGGTWCTGRRQAAAGGSSIFNGLPKQPKAM